MTSTEKGQGGGLSDVKVVLSGAIPEYQTIQAEQQDVFNNVTGENNTPSMLDSLNQVGELGKQIITLMDSVISQHEGMTATASKNGKTSDAWRPRVDREADGEGPRSQAVRAGTEKTAEGISNVLTALGSIASDLVTKRELFAAASDGIDELKAGVAQVGEHAVTSTTGAGETVTAMEIVLAKVVG